MSTFENREKVVKGDLTTLSQSFDRSQATPIQLPQNYHLVYPETVIKEAVQRIASQLTEYACEVSGKNQGKELLVLMVREGGIYFGCAVTQEIKAPIEIATIMTKTYETGTNQTKATRAQVDFGTISVKDRDIVLIDDIDDLGKNRLLLLETVTRMGARSCKFAVLINRRGSKPTEPDFIGLNYDGEEWFVGFGMDDRGKWRHLKQIYLIKNS